MKSVIVMFSLLMLIWPAIALQSKPAATKPMTITQYMRETGLLYAERWAKSGMPVTRRGRYVYASKDELSRWLGREAGMPEAVRIASENEELAADLKRSVANTCKQRRRRAA